MYNGELYISQAIESLLAQTYTNFELIICDNASTDSTVALCQKFARQDDRVTVIESHRNRGQVANFLKAFDAGKGKYFAWAGDHDIWHPEWAEVLVDSLEHNPGVVLAYPQTVAISPDGVEIPDNFANFETLGLSKRARIDAVCRRMIGAGNKIFGMFRSEALRRTSVYPKFSGPDRLLLMELSAQGAFKQIDHRLWYRRYRAGESAVAAGIPDAYQTQIQRYRQYLFDTEQGIPWHASFPILSHVLGLIVHMSLKRNFVWGPYMARIYFKRRKHFILRELRLALNRLVTSKFVGQ